MKTRIAYALGLLTAGLGTIVLAGCPEEVVPVDAVVLTDSPPIITEDTPTPPIDMGIRRDTNAATCGTRGNLGGQCAAGECFEPYVCQEEVVREVPSVLRSDPTMPGRPYPVRYWPGGQCQGTCDPNANGQCNACSTCLQTGTDASGNALGECFQSCEQDVDGLGGCNDGYSCDRANLACTIACTVVAGVDSCQFAFEDRDTDPLTRETIVDEGASFPSTCNTTTGLCETRGTAGATAGDDCEDDMDCEDDGLCLSGDDPETPVTLRDGYCIRLGCNETDLPCQDGDVCSQSLFGLPGGVCIEGCVVGSETTAAQVSGAGGGNPNCGEGEACFWDGVHGVSDTLNGGCYAGNYNDVPAYNVGAACDADDDCWSPYGLGRCLFGEGNSLGDRVGSGICAIGGCGQSMAGIGLATSDGVVPVMDSNAVCQTAAGSGGTNNDICVGFSASQTFCVSGCTTAADCPSGYSCPNLGDALRPLRICWPACQVDADCNTGARCLNDSRTTCNPDTDTCYCTDSMPRPDGGVLPRDAGTDAFTAPDAFAAPDAPAATDDAFVAPDAFAG